MNSSFFNGVSGIKTHQFGLDVWADNISNISSHGFRSYTPEFSTIFSTTMTQTYFGASMDDKGYGSSGKTTAMSTQNGIIENTDNPFDLALDGDGWFGVTGLGGETYYTRAGAFSVDANGMLVDKNGNFLLGTLGENVAAIELESSDLEEFGKYYDSGEIKEGNPFSVTPLEDVAISAVDQQQPITLPEFLYHPSIPTANVSFKANLNPQITTSLLDIPLDSADYVTEVIADDQKKVSISGGVANTTEVLNPQEGDEVFVGFTDIDGRQSFTSAKLDENLEWSVEEWVVGELNTDSPITVSAQIKTTQEVRNKEHFMAQLIAPNGDKDMLDLTLTKQVPQATDSTIWDATAQTLKFYENYDSQKTYDSSLYRVYESIGKVYEILEEQNGTFVFDGNGQYISNSLPAVTNRGEELNLNFGSGWDGLVSNINTQRERAVSADGTPEGKLKAYGMDSGGNVIAEFDNGQNVAIAKVAVYQFQNDQGLERISGTYFKDSSNSGKPIFFADADGNVLSPTKVISQGLEGSNVSMSIALTELIVMQKAFDASSKCISTSDQMIQNAINMKK